MPKATAHAARPNTAGRALQVIKVMRRSDESRELIAGPPKTNTGFPTSVMTTPAVHVCQGPAPVSLAQIEANQVYHPSKLDLVVSGAVSGMMLVSRTHPSCKTLLLSTPQVCQKSFTFSIDRVRHPAISSRSQSVKPIQPSNIANGNRARRSDGMKRKCSIGLLLGGLMLLLLAPSASAQGVIVPSAGPINSAMAGASTAAPVDFGASYWNPAILSGLKSRSFCLARHWRCQAFTCKARSRPTRSAACFRPRTDLVSRAATTGVAAGLATGFSFRMSDDSPVTMGLGVFGLVGGGVNFPGSYQVPILTPRLPPRYFGFGPIYSNVGLLSIAADGLVAGLPSVWRSEAVRSSPRARLRFHPPSSLPGRKTRLASPPSRRPPTRGRIGARLPGRLVL